MGGNAEVSSNLHKDHEGRSLAPFFYKPRQYSVHLSTAAFLSMVETKRNEKYQFIMQLTFSSQHILGLPTKDETSLTTIKGPCA